MNDPADPTVNDTDAALVIAGAVVTVRVNAWVASDPTPLCAVNVSAYVPAVPAAGVPPRVAVPSPLSTNVTPDGNAPDSDNDGFGRPVQVTVNDPADPTVNDTDAALVIAGAVVTVRVNAWMASDPTPLCAVNVSAYVPAVPAAGVPARVAVPSPLSTNVTPDGNAPDSDNDGGGDPAVVTVNDPAAAAVNDTDAALVIAGAVVTDGLLTTQSARALLYSVCTV